MEHELGRVEDDETENERPVSERVESMKGRWSQGRKVVWVNG